MGTSLTNSHRGHTDALCHRLMEPGVSARTVQGGTSSLPMPLVLEDTDCQQGSPEETVQAHSRMSSVRFHDHQCFQKQKGGGEASRAGQEGSKEPAGLSTPQLQAETPSTMSSGRWQCPGHKGTCARCSICTEPWALLLSTPPCLQPCSVINKLHAVGPV